MTFVYYYKSSDGARHEAQMEAPTREAVFAALRERGIRAIKVVAKDAPTPPRGVRKRVVAVLAITVACVAAVVSWLAATHFGETSGDIEITEGASGARANGSKSIAQPLPRQRIPGNRARLEAAPPDLFAHPLERYLSRFAEPGRKLEDIVLTPEIEADLKGALADPIRIASDEWTEYIDLKRIVAGMKRELKAYLAAGGTLREYAAELVKRQKLELSYREKAESQIERLLQAEPEEGKSAESLQAETYDYWLKANASLQAMGIAPIPLPDELRAYQLTLEIDDFE